MSNTVLFENLCKKYELATNSKLDPTKLSLGNEASWTTHKALDSLKFEPNGNLATLLLYKAWQEQKRDARVKLSDIISNPKWIEHMQDFEKELNEGDAYKLLLSTITLTENIANKFGINGVKDLLNDNSIKFIDMFAEAYQNHYKDGYMEISHILAIQFLMFVTLWMMYLIGLMSFLNLN